MAGAHKMIGVSKVEIMRGEKTHNSFRPPVSGMDNLFLIRGCHDLCGNDGPSGAARGKNVEVKPDPAAAKIAFDEGNSALLICNDCSLAIKYFKKAIKLNPDFPEAFEGRGLANFRKGDLDGAIGDYGAAIKKYARMMRLNPDDKALMLGYARAFKKRGEANAKKGDSKNAKRDREMAQALRVVTRIDNGT